MKFAGARGITRSRVPLIAMLALAATIGLAGCEGDDGKDGLAGAPGTPGTTGATGPIGPTGPTGPAGPSATIEPRESCGVCHANGSAYGVAESHAVAADITVSNVTFAVSGADLVISYNLKTNGANAANFTGPAQRLPVRRHDAHRPVRQWRMRSRWPVARMAITRSPSPTARRLGNSRYMLRIANSTDSRHPNQRHRGGRLSGLARRSAGQHGRLLRLPWHQRRWRLPLRLPGQRRDLHGLPRRGEHELSAPGRHRPRHPRLARHAGRRVCAEDGRRSDSWTYSATYPTYMTNCSVCHTASSGALAKANAMPVTGEGCLSCHGSMESWEFAAGLDFHESYTEATNCTTCHNDTAGAVAREPGHGVPQRSRDRARRHHLRRRRPVRHGRREVQLDDHQGRRQQGDRHAGDHLDGRVPEGHADQPVQHDGDRDRAGVLPVRAEYRGRGHVEHAAQLRAGR